LDNYMDWLRKLQDDLIEQFRGQPNIAIFNKAVARQFNELYAFFYQLYVLQWLDQAEGAQLDGIGNIVDLSRTDALIWANMARLNVPMDDALYRLYLMFKIFLNTSEGTYREVYRTLKMFWPYTPIEYSEQIEHPATMFWTLTGVPGDANFYLLRIAERAKAAGVALRFIATSRRPEVQVPLNIVGQAFLSNSSVKLPRIGREHEFETNLHTAAQAWNFNTTTLPVQRREQEFTALVNVRMQGFSFNSTELPNVTPVGLTAFLQKDDGTIEPGWLLLDDGSLHPLRLGIDE